MQKRCATLACMGTVVISYDMVGYGDCLQVDHRSMPIALLLQTWNSKRVLEYLLSRYDVDEERIGMTGTSAGGYQTFILAAIDERIKVSVPTVMVSAHYFGVCMCESSMPIHKSTHHQTNNVEIAALCAPRPMMLISDGVDYTRNTPQIEYPYIQKVYALYIYNAEHKEKNIHLADENHNCEYSKRKYIYPFFAHYLKLNTSKVNFNPTVEEDFVTILPNDELNSDNNPMPEDALKGNKSVIEYLGQYMDLSEYNLKQKKKND